MAGGGQGAVRALTQRPLGHDLWGGEEESSIRHHRKPATQALRHLDQDFGGLVAAVDPDQKRRTTAASIAVPAANLNVVDVVLNEDDVAKGARGFVGGGGLKR